MEVGRKIAFIIFFFKLAPLSIFPVLFNGTTFSEGPGRKKDSILKLGDLKIVLNKLNRMCKQGLWKQRKDKCNTPRLATAESVTTQGLKGQVERVITRNWRE